MNSCIHCSNDHTYVCDCGHTHSEHNFSGGCTVKVKQDGQLKFCPCERYSQLKQRKH